MMPNDRHPRGGCIGTGPDPDGIAAANATRGPESCLLPAIGEVWRDRPRLPAHLAGAWFVCRHPGTRVGRWMPLRESLRTTKATARTVYVNTLGYYRRGAVVLCAPDGTVDAACFCTPTRRDP